MNKPIYLLRNVHSSKQELGSLLVFDNDGNKLFESRSLERAWKDNKKNISCIPDGIYPIRLEYSPRFNRMLWEIYDVPGRSECKIHSANYWFELNGCIAPGHKVYDLNKDGVPDITRSRYSLKKFEEAMFPDTSSFIHVITARK